MAEPPERNSSTSMPVCCLNSAAIFCACSIGVEVYQLTLPSAFALATSTTSCACAGESAISAAAQSMSLNLSIVVLQIPFRTNSVGEHRLSARHGGTPLPIGEREGV